MRRSSKSVSETTSGNPGHTMPDVRPSYLVDQVIKAMQAALRQQVYKKGERLPAEAELAKRFKVGRSTIREALRVLSHLGLTETWTGRGTFVVRTRVEDRPPPQGELQYAQIEDIFRFRFSLEVEAAKRAARLRTPQQLAAIKEALGRAKAAVVAGDFEQAVSADLDMHVAILQAAGSQFAADIYAANRARMEQAARMVIGAAGRLPSGKSVHPVQSLHDDLITSIERGDASAAAAAVRRDGREFEVRLRLLRS